MAESKGTPGTEKVRTTMEPDRDTEVSPAERTDLERWGLIKPATTTDTKAKG